MRWLSIILNRPVLTMAELDMVRPAVRRALALAEAEARHVQAVAALQAFEAGEAEPSPALLSDLEFSRTLAQLSQHGQGDRGLTRLANDLFSKVSQRIEDEIAPGGKRHRLLQRYAAETKSARKAAFRAWLEAEEEERGILENA
ncbi:hypothetical protein HKCCSP123_05170 [Rhodobacterales bacterium HKCCSP123]|nr:hypothetical protein [Rhodobacterales bacterium HKCCSP123]